MAIISTQRAPAQLVSLINSGTLQITGTTANVGVPAGAPNTLVARRVRLHDQPTGRVLREVWSNAATGAYTFARLAPGTYYVTAFDHTGQYAGVIETDLVPEPMP